MNPNQTTELQIRSLLAGKGKKLCLVRGIGGSLTRPDGDRELRSCRLRPDLTIARYTASESLLVPVLHNFWREKSAHEIYLRWNAQPGTQKVRLTAYCVRACSSVDCRTRRANLSRAFSAGRSSRHEMCNASSVRLPHNATARTAWLTKEIA